MVDWINYHGAGRVRERRSFILWGKEAENKEGTRTMHDLHQHRAPENYSPTKDTFRHS